MTWPQTFWSECGIYARNLFQIAILTFLIYRALHFVKGTRAAASLAGLFIIGLTLKVLSQLMDLEVIAWILSRMWTFLALSILILFQPELRRAFAEIGRQNLISHSGKIRRNAELITMLLDSTFYLADRRIGALIAIQQSIGLRTYTETGTYINSPASSKLLSTIFFPNTPLHDGGVIIQDGELVAAGCIFPLTQDRDLSKSLGTRHRAAVGLTEETDAVVIIVSEESGAVSLSHRGRLTRGVDRERLQRHLTNFLVKSNIAKKGRKGSAILPLVPEQVAEKKDTPPTEEGTP
ncbi:MAG: diadenylate cyclase CdaA [Lentisphaeria bacterium]|nr:diadenylate cyclase CdaA [Lentisphaeria bacterium]